MTALKIANPPIIRRIAIIGNSGSGKSTLARQLAAGNPILDLDTVYWVPGQIAVRRSAEEAAAEVRAFCQANECWVVEGCYASLVDVALEYGAELIWLDPGEAACLEHCRNRPWEPHKYRSKAEQDAHLDSLLEWVKAYDTRDDEMAASAHRALFDAFPGPKQKRG